jgi:hypothetical protein
MAVIPATPEIRIRRIIVQSQIRQKVSKNPSQGGKRWGRGQGGEMTQTMYVHMNK